MPALRCAPIQPPGVTYEILVPGNERELPTLVGGERGAGQATVVQARSRA
jgi:hypothetical protein